MKIPTPEEIANEILSVQPMPSDTFKKLYDASKSEEDLLKEGYKPVSSDTRLMWVKPGEKNATD